MFVHATNVADAEGDARKLVCYDCGVACDLSAMREERLVALRVLGAEERRAPAPPVQKRTDATRRPVPLPQGEPRRYRFGYTKIGASAFLSHLDLIRALPRAFRRLSLPLFYSQGFHPKPDMTFGPALSLGVSSLVEIVDVKICADFDPADVLAALSEGAQDGTVFTGGVRLGPNDASVPRVVDAARYVVAIPRSAVASEAWLDERVAAVRDATTLPVVRRIDGVGKKLDVREYLRRIGPGADEAKSAVARAGIVGDFFYLTVDVEIRGSGAVKIGEVVEVLAGAELPHRAVRTELGRWIGDGSIASPMNLGAVAKSKAADLVSRLPPVLATTEA